MPESDHITSFHVHRLTKYENITLVYYSHSVLAACPGLAATLSLDLGVAVAFPDTWGCRGRGIPIDQSLVYVAGSHFVLTNRPADF